MSKENSEIDSETPLKREMSSVIKRMRLDAETPATSKQSKSRFAEIVERQLKTLRDREELNQLTDSERSIITKGRQLSIMKAFEMITAYRKMAKSKSIPENPVLFFETLKTPWPNWLMRQLDVNPKIEVDALHVWINIEKDFSEQNFSSTYIAIAFLDIIDKGLKGIEFDGNSEERMGAMGRLMLVSMASYLHPQTIKEYAALDNRIQGQIIAALPNNLPAKL